MEREHEKLQKGVQLKKKELHIQEDEVFRNVDRFEYRI